MPEYNPSEIESTWQKRWQEEGQYAAKDEDTREKYYALVEFPYPSGDGLHVGHPRPYIGMDVIARKRRMEGYNVLFPIGWDAFGLPTENFAIKTGKDPKQVTKENSDTFRRQIQSLGISFDWSREINTTDPKYYKWTQWIFLKFFERGLAYKSKQLINWCPKDKIGLANEEVVNGRCERCGTVVEKREKEQWMLRITAYAERLLKDLDTVDYQPRIKLQQQNWIGKSEGALIKFDNIEIFTTRPDTIFGATFVAVAPEVAKKLYGSDFGITSETDRENKEKLGADTGHTVMNPATKEPIPVWVVNYVSADYGTGAIMAVPAHDERDFEFAKKFGLPIRHVIEPTYEQTTEPGKIKEGEPFDHREAIIAIVKHWKEDKYIALKWKQVAWGTFVTGGIEEGQTPEEAAKMELREEIGFTDAKFIKDFGVVHGKFYHVPKKTNRNAHAHVIYLELQSDKKVETSEAEKAIHEVQWLGVDELKKFLTPDTHQHALSWLLGDTSPYTGEGTLTNSGEFNRLESAEAKIKITKAVGGTMVTKYKLRDWVFSRQRYWGEPIPVVHCAKCALRDPSGQGIVPVPEKDLPVLLPEVENYQPTDTGESPLANITDWVNTTCPKCGGAAKRETDTMPNWAGSSWYFLRYADPHNDKEFASGKRLKHWMPVDWYNGGMEHTTLHLLYSRFWNKFLFDLGLVPTSEPYKKRTSHGLILAEGGEKMSKSKGNVVNPDDIVQRFGADTLRLYEMFMGPFDQAIAWSEDALVGPRRFIEKVWRLNVGSGSANEALMHQTIKKVSEDIESMGFNTAVSSLMIWVNDLEKREVSAREYETLLKLLAPFAPHVAEELWHKLGHRDSIHTSAWPVFDPAKLVQERVKIAIQVNGKLRAMLELAANTDESEVRKMALDMPEINKWLEGKEPSKVIVVPGRVVNIVVS